MDTTNPTSAPLTSAAAMDLDAAPFGADDPRMAFGRAVALGTAVIGAVRPDQLEQPTPCTEKDVRTMLQHMVSVVRRVAVMGRGGSPFEVPDETADIPDDGYLDAWSSACHEIMDVWTDAVLDRELQLPWTRMSGRDTLGIYTAEVLVHTWDLAVATGQRAEFPEDACELGLDAYRAEMPAEGRAERFEAARVEMGGVAFEPPFRASVPVGDDAPAIDRLVGHSGRDPRWAAAR